MEASRPKFRRTQYLVAKKFQLTYVGQILALMFLTAILCSYVIYYTMMILMGEKLAAIYPQGRLVSIVSIINFRIFISVILVAPLVVLIGILLSHRIAGPIYRMGSFLNSMAAGNLSSRLVLRKGDELVPLANGINQVIDSFKGTITNQKEALSKVSAELDSIKMSLASGRREDSGINSTISGLENKVNDLFKELDKYKL